MPLVPGEVISSSKDNMSCSQRECFPISNRLNPYGSHSRYHHAHISAQYGNMKTMLSLILFLLDRGCFCLGRRRVSHLPKARVYLFAAARINSPPFCAFVLIPPASRLLTQCLQHSKVLNREYPKRNSLRIYDSSSLTVALRSHREWINLWQGAI